MAEAAYAETRLVGAGVRTVPDAPRAQPAIRDVTERIARLNNMLAEVTADIVSNVDRILGPIPSKAEKDPSAQPVGSSMDELRQQLDRYDQIISILARHGAERIRGI